MLVFVLLERVSRTVETLAGGWLTFISPAPQVSATGVDRGGCLDLGETLT